MKKKKKLYLCVYMNYYKKLYNLQQLCPVKKMSISLWYVQSSSEKEERVKSFDAGQAIKDASKNLYKPSSSRTNTSCRPPAARPSRGLDPTTPPASSSHHSSSTSVAIGVIIPPP